MNRFPNKNLGNVGNETQVGVGIDGKRERVDIERSASVTVADHMPTLSVYLL